MAKKNLRSHAADSSPDDRIADSPEQDFSREANPEKPARGRTRSTVGSGDAWPESPVARPQRARHQSRAAESDAQDASPQSSEASDSPSGDRNRHRGRARNTRQVDRLAADQPDFLEESSDFLGSSDSGSSQRGSQWENTNGHESRDSYRGQHRNSYRESNGEGDMSNREFGGEHSQRGERGSDQREGNRDGRRRSRRRRGGGGGGGNAGGTSPQGRQNQDNQRGGSRRSRRGRNNNSSNSGRQNFNQDRNRNQDRNQIRNQPRHQEPVELDDAELFEGIGLLEVHPNGYGFLRHPDNSYAREKSDPFVPGTMIEKFSLRPGVILRGMIQPARRQQGPRLRELQDVDGMPPEEYVNVKNFDELTPINPVYWYRLESGPAPLTTRVMDLLTPLGKGQRALIVAPPRSGKTVMLQHIANGIAENHPKTKLIVLLIDERPEEVTDMKRSVRGEVIASSLDEDIESHVRLSQVVIARCKRLAEMGQDVFLLMDSITRLARAFNKWVGNTGRTMSGGVDIKAMDIPKKLFSSARAFEEGGSLTIVGTALVDTGSRMDELIFQEFKGTGNMELVLDRKLADRRVWPAIDISQSGTRREELLLHPDTLHAVTMLRRTLTSMNHVEAMEQLTKQLSRFKTNQEFINLISGKMGEL